MNTKIVTIDKSNINKGVLLQASVILRTGGLVAFPTETVYGLGADGLNEEAAKKIYQAKGRPSDNPLIIHIADVESLQVLAVDISESALQLAGVFWPGPLTMILKKSGIVPYSTTGGLDTVAIRMPSNPIALALIKEAGVYVAAPSANLSGRPSPTKASHVIEDLNGRIEMIIDGGTVDIGVESTIIDMTSDVPMVLRPGQITVDMLKEQIGSISIDPVIAAECPAQDIKPKAPGMKYKHYAPKAPLIIYEGDMEKVIQKINLDVLKYSGEGKKAGIIATEEFKKEYKQGVIKVIGSRKQEGSIAHSLYSVLREFDEEEVDIIVTESFRDGRLGQAVMNRLLKAAGYHVIKVE